MKLSVIVCTYNRSEFLKDLIASLQEQDLPGDYEIVVVDNNSTDNTRDVVRGLIGTSRIPIRYVFEGSQGLSHARNSGIRESHGEILAFIDDDAVAEKQWLSRLMSGYDNEKVGCVGGKIELIWPFEKPDWVTPPMEMPLGKLDYGDSVRELKFPLVPFGGNISIRKTVFDALGSFSTKLGRDLKTLLSNEELELCSRIVQNGWTIKYVPDAVVHHKVDPRRLRKLWFYHRAYWQGRSDAVLDLSVKSDIYARLRKYASELLWREVYKSESDFERERLNRSFKGYLHQILEIPKKEMDEDAFRRLRALEAFQGGLKEASAKMVIERESKISELVKYIDEKHEDLRKFSGLMHEKDENLKQLEGRLRQIEIDKNNKIAELKKYIDEKHEDLKKFSALMKEREEQLNLNNERIESLETDLRVKSEEIKQRDEQLCEKSEELMRMCGEGSAEKQKLEAELKRRDAAFEKINEQLKEKDKVLKEREDRISDLLNSMSWKVTAPLRTIYRIFKKPKQ